MLSRSILLSAGAILLLVAPVSAQDGPAVTGRILLPEGSTLDGATAWSLEIQDTSLADAPAATISAVGGPVELPAATEIPFAAPFDPASIDDAASYTLSARIVDAAGELVFINDTAVPVITGGAPIDGVDVPVVAVGTSTAGESRVIELEADPALRFLQDGEQVREIAVTPGETVVFRIDNTAGFAHNFYIGADADLQVPNGATDTGIPDWDSGIGELEWVVPEDISGIRFACTVPGHYTLMQGDFVIAE